MLIFKGQDFRPNQQGDMCQNPVLICASRYLFLLALFVVFFQFTVPAAFSQTLPDEIVAGVPKNFPPHYMINEETGEPAGFAIDVMNSIAMKSGLKVRYNVYDTWGAVHSALKAGTIDVIPNMGITAERMSFADFTKPVETLQIKIFVRSTTSQIQGSEDLTGRRVAVVETNKGRFLMEKRGGVELQIYSSIEKALLALLSGKADALVFPDTVINRIVNEAGIEAKIKTAGRSLFEIKRAIAVQKGFPELLERLDAVVNDFVLSPEYKEIYTRWYSSPEPYWGVKRVIILMGISLAIITVLLLVWRYISILRINRKLKIAEEESSLFFSLIDQSSDSVFVIDPETSGFVNVNEAACTGLGYTREELLSMHVIDIESMIQDNLSWDEHVKELQAKKSIILEGGHKRKDGTIFPVEISAKYITHDWKDNIVAFVRDITERKRADDELKARTKELENINKAFIGRELKMADIKNEIEELKKKQKS